ncbi:MAG: PepSY-associated TM helix domain-containing protein [Longimicrobiales bacterium]
MTLRLRPLLRTTHLWVGVALSLLLLVLAVTGSALVYKEAYWRAVYPELRGPAPAVGPAEHAAAIAASAEAFGPELRSVKLPEPGVPAYHLYLEGGEAFVAADDFRVLDRWSPTGRLMGLLFDVHAHLLAGERGEQVGGVVALLGSFLVLSGVVLWWPARRRFRARHLLPHGTSRPALIQWHRDLGMLTTPLLLVLLLSGAGIVFYGAAGRILNGVFGDPPLPAEPAAPTTSALPAGPAGPEVVAAAQDAFPDARLVFYYPPGPAGEVHRFRAKRPCEVHPNGRSAVHVDGAARVVLAVDACTLPPGERALHALYPLHAGKTGGALYKALAFLGGLALAALSASGVWAYGLKLRRSGWGVGTPGSEPAALPLSGAGRHRTQKLDAVPPHAAAPTEHANA